MRERIAEQRRARRFDQARTGVRSRQFAQERLDSFIRANARPLTGVVFGAALFAVVLWFVMSPLSRIGNFALGLFVAGVAGALYHWCVIASGAANGTMGQAAEEWTSSELRRLRRGGWRTISNLVFRHGDIDHIAVGPDGVIVVETKWQSAALCLDRPGDALDKAVRQVDRNKRDVAGHLGWGAREDARITSLVVVWGPAVTQEGDEAILTGDGVNIVAGEHLRTVLGDLTETELDGGEIDGIYDKLTRWVETKDRWTEERSEPRAATVSERFRDWLERLAVGFVGLSAAAAGLALGWWYFALAALLLALGLVARQFDRVRTLGSVWIIATQAMTALVLILLLVDLASGS